MHWWQARSGSSWQNSRFWDLKQGRKSYHFHSKKLFKRRIDAHHKRLNTRRTIYTDDWKAYDGLILNGYDHYRIFHSHDEFARGKNHVNGIESFWPFAKRRLTKFNNTASHKTSYNGTRTANNISENSASLCAYIYIYTSHADGIRIKATKKPYAVSFKTGPYPNFPTDLQALMMAALLCTQDMSMIEETIFENRLQHAQPLAQLGANIEIIHSNKAKIVGVDTLYGADVVGHDIRAVCALVLAELVAKASTRVFGVSHWLRGFEGLEKKLNILAAQIDIIILEKVV